MSDCSIFVDESGGQRGTSKYYAITLVVHEQSDNLEEHINRYKNLLRTKNLPDVPFHASPLFNGHEGYASLDIKTRKGLFSLFFTFFRKLPIRYRTFLYPRSEVRETAKLVARMKRGIVNLLFDNLDYFQRFDKVKIYYDDGQQAVSRALRGAFDYALSREAVLHRKASPTDYRLAQVADFLCAIELAAEKYRKHEQARTDEKFFGSAGSFRGNYLKIVRRKRLP